MFSMRVDPKAVIGHLTDLEERQFPFAVALALDKVSRIDASGAERAHIKDKFKLRREAFIFRQVYISKQDRANKHSWRVVIQLQGQFKDLEQFEAGEERVNARGKFLWQPNPDVFKSKVIGSGNPLAPKNLKFHKDPSGRVVGAERTFMVRTKGQLLVLQREEQRLTKRSKAMLGKMTLDSFKGGHGPGQKREKHALSRTAGVRLLYTLRSRVRIPAKLEFVDTITRTVQAQFPVRMVEAMAEALRSAR